MQVSTAALPFTLHTRLNTRTQPQNLPIKELERPSESEKRQNLWRLVSFKYSSTTVKTISVFPLHFNG